MSRRKKVPFHFYQDKEKEAELKTRSNLSKLKSKKRK